MKNLRQFPLGKGLLDASGSLYVNSYGRAIITKYCAHGAPNADTSVILEDDFSNRDYLNTWLPGNVLANYGLGRLQSEWVYQFSTDLSTDWERWDISSGKFKFPYNNWVGFFFANPQEQELFQPGELPTPLDYGPDAYGFASSTPAYDPSGGEVVIDDDNRHFRLDLNIGWAAGITKTVSLSPYTTTLNSISLSISSGTATLGGSLAMSTGNTSYSSPIKLSFIWQSRGYENALTPNFNYNQLKVEVNDSEVTRSHCRVGSLSAPNIEAPYSPPVVVNFKRLLSNLTTWETTFGLTVVSRENYLLKVDGTGTNPSQIYTDLVTLSQESVDYDDCAINAVGRPKIKIQNSDYALAHATYDQGAAGGIRGANSSAYTLVRDPSFPKYIGTWPMIPRPLYIYSMMFRINEYAQPIVRIGFSSSSLGANLTFVDYTIAGVYPNYVYPLTMTAAKTSSGSWPAGNLLGTNTEFVVTFV